MHDARKQPCILIADDDRDLVAMVSRMLEANGYEVIPTFDAYQALHFAREQQPDLLIVDINMPAGDGVELLNRFEQTEHGPDCHLIYLTGEHSERVQKAARKHGAFAILYKPFEMDTMLETVRRALASKRTIPMVAPAEAHAR